MCSGRLHDPTLNQEHPAAASGGTSTATSGEISCRADAKDARPAKVAYAHDAGGVTQWQDRRYMAFAQICLANPCEPSPATTVSNRPSLTDFGAVTGVLPRSGHGPGEPFW